MSLLADDRSDTVSVVRLPSRLTPGEALAVVVALATQPAPPGVEPEDRAGALAKALVVLDAEDREHAEQVASAVLATAPPPPDPVVDVLAEGLRRRLVIQLDYVDGDGDRSRRRVEPLLLAESPDRDYLVAWCQQREAIRWFRRDRIRDATLTTTLAPPRKLPLHDYDPSRG
jgi:predicted DNA-binding transcriptional regulator YafY